MSSTHTPHPPLDAYSPEEFAVVVDRADVPYVDATPEDRARSLITGKKGRGPHCEDCGMKPAGMQVVRTEGDWGQLERYECLCCGNKQSGKRRRQYGDSESDTDS